MISLQRRRQIHNQCFYHRCLTILEIKLNPHITNQDHATRKQNIVCIVGQQEGFLNLSYRGTGNFADTLWEKHAKNPGFRDLLWEDTVFEAFIQPWGMQEYEEWNFSPTGNWAHYHFSAYRKGRKKLAKTQPPAINCILEPSKFGFQVDVRIQRKKEPAAIGICAVIKDKNSNQTYWAIRHSYKAPDFHHQESFGATLNTGI